MIPTASEQEYLKALASHMAVTLDRIHLLNKRRQAEQSLSQSEEKYRALAENIPNVVFQCKMTCATPLYILIVPLKT
ncbi:hypothetical protein [Candidatus Villigracilis affinis]|uniref:hypothetical protein n=1 Tax=Candidatus Villigracilis affinis TaxID=3140682 RepID=UPI002A19CE5D|nr:hypothetical protein [Anaerolineales bacterium]